MSGLSSSDFFSEIRQAKAPWAGGTINLPVFYYDASTLSIQFLVAVNRLRKLLPSPRIQPLRVTPWHSVLTISALEYRDCDIGPYNEVSLGIPMTLDHPSPLFTGTLNPVPTIPQVYIRHLPVTTDIALKAGIEFAGYPKFLAKIVFEKDGSWTSCHLQEGEQHILTLRGRAGELQDAQRSRIQPITVRGGYMLSSELIISERLQCQSQRSRDAQLDLGDHPIAQELKELRLNRMIGFQYAPQHQALLTPANESFKL
ncbi:acetoacetate decarboxylase family protein [Acaryochloris sp. CCMEE 5410]|uniref:acetoacetate decarboxylase family protein n=1 Tax=Acaryochloris sp. CCMEE 5410 TaxID=310037 RepID=UPI0002484C02|nr:acetoacetate decarboxylase family protein [Acaryochloris sp. CCMEE 5410]KAI9132612.1 acetoacetate decarboxylase family protein [Acaryochloris sp. CCMEE 5410]